MDIIGGFIEDICELESDQRTSLGSLYFSYQEWADQACQDTIGKKEFGNLMRQKGYSQGKSGSARYWRGLVIKQDSEN